jgi:hypothetical protein
MAAFSGLLARNTFRLIIHACSVRNEFNAVMVEGAFAEKQVFIGKGAGSYPTGSAVLSDISALHLTIATNTKNIHKAMACLSRMKHW